jgi:hypothetical protein
VGKAFAMITLLPKKTARVVASGDVLVTISTDKVSKKFEEENGGQL